MLHSGKQGRPAPAERGPCTLSAHQPGAKAHAEGRRPLLVVAGEAEGWWRKMDATDPISLEPLCELPCPPFWLPPSRPRARYIGVVERSVMRGENPNCWFDGRMLANYLESRSCFVHPISRRKLQLQECEALDAFLGQHALGQANIVRTFAASRWRLERREAGERREEARRAAAVDGEAALHQRPAPLGGGDRSV